VAGNLEKQFDIAMMNIYHRAKYEAKYTASIFFYMVNTKGGLITAKQLINSKEPSDGYTQLWLKGRLDLTVEALVVEDVKWHSLFTDEEIASAEARLRAHDYHPKAIK
jgi:hypothetical protein